MPSFGAEPRPRKANTPPRARWPHLERADLADARRCLELARELVRRELLPCTEWSLLRVFEAAEHALAVGRNPPALFARTLRDPHMVTELEADRARVRALEAQGRARHPSRHHDGLARLAELIPAHWLT